MQYRFDKLAQYLRGWLGYFGICHGRHYPVVRCVPAALHLRPSSSIVRAFSRGLPTYYAVC